jgi:hypothetical protein
MGVVSGARLVAAAAGCDCVFSRRVGFFGRRGSSAGDVLWACFDEGALGEFPKAVFLDGRRRVESSEESRNVEKQKKL